MFTMGIDSSAVRSLFIDSSLSEFFDETDLFFIDFESGVAKSCNTLRYLGYEDADLLDIWDAFPVHEADRERVELMQRRIESGETDKVIDSFRIVSKKDSRFPWMRFSMQVLGRGPDGKPTTLIGHVTDVDDLIASQEEIRERLVEIDAMRELIGAINKSLDFEETFSRIIEQLRRIIPFDRASVQAFENDSLTVITGYGYPTSDIMGLVFPAKGIDNPAVRAIQTKRPIVCNDVPNDFPGFVAPSKDFTTLSWLGIPMVYEGQVIGLIALDSRFHNFYTDQHVRVATAVAEHIATAFEHARSHQLVTVQAMTDRLTGLANRYGLETRGMELFQKAIENDQSIGVFMLDIDHFKVVNDTYGHSYGDLVLQQIASTIRTQIRNEDYAVRYGGEEFVVLLPGLGPRESLLVAERLRIKISQTEVEKGRKLPTVSIGIYAAVPGSLDILHEFIRKADLALYTAKEAGRNRSRVWSTSPEFYVSE